MINPGEKKERTLGPIRISAEKHEQINHLAKIHNRKLTDQVRALIDLGLGVAQHTIDREIKHTIQEIVREELARYESEQKKHKP